MSLKRIILLIITAFSLLAPEVYTQRRGGGGMRGMRGGRMRGMRAGRMRGMRGGRMRGMRGRGDRFRGRPGRFGGRRRPVRDLTGRRRDIGRRRFRGRRRDFRGRRRPFRRRRIGRGYGYYGYPYAYYGWPWWWWPYGYGNGYYDYDGYDSYYPTRTTYVKKEPTNLDTANQTYWTVTNDTQVPLVLTNAAGDELTLNPFSQTQLSHEAGFTLHVSTVDGQFSSTITSREHNLRIIFTPQGRIGIDTRQ